MPHATKQQVRDHLNLLKRATSEDMDELLHDILAIAWPSKKAQDS